MRATELGVERRRRLPRARSWRRWRRRSSPGTRRRAIGERSSGASRFPDERIHRAETTAPAVRRGSHRAQSPVRLRIVRGSSLNRPPSRHGAAAELAAVPGARPGGRRAARRAALRGRYACVRKDRMTRATARRISPWSCATAPARSRRGSSASRTGSARASSAATRCGRAARSSASAASCSRDRRRPRGSSRGALRPRGVPARRLPLGRGARRLPRAPDARDLRPGAARRRRAGARRPSRSRPSSAARRARAAATTPTSAACSSTRSPSATLVGELCQLHPRLDSDLLMAAALLHDVGKTREFTYGAEFGISEEGRLLGHLAIGAEIIGAAAGDAARRAAAGAAQLRALPPRPRGRAAGSRRRLGPQRLRLARGAALYRLNALDARVKGALEHGVSRLTALGSRVGGRRPAVRWPLALPRCPFVRPSRRARFAARRSRPGRAGARFGAPQRRAAELRSWRRSSASSRLRAWLRASWATAVTRGPSAP